MVEGGHKGADRSPEQSLSSKDTSAAEKGDEGAEKEEKEIGAAGAACRRLREDAWPLARDRFSPRFWLPRP